MNKNLHMLASISNFIELKGANLKDKPANLIVQGQGTVVVNTDKDHKISELIFKFESGDKGVQVCIESNKTTVKLKNADSTWSEDSHIDDGIDPDPTCQYWISIDDHNYRVRYGKGEMRPQTMLIDLKGSYFEPKDSQSENDKDNNSWLHELKSVDVKCDITELKCVVWEKPVTVAPPLIVVNTNQITMNDVASNEKTVIQNLPFACQQLFANVGGEEFILNTPDFLDFEDAINYSINTPGAWCYEKLKEKSSEFGHDDPDETYLRITMGVNQGNSPGIPYVMEIWPYEHYSPIHNHAGANAIIRVLAGEITVRLYSMLSKYHEEYFAKAVFKKDDLTWITPDINQIHKLKNEATDKRACITIQCYQYGEKNTEHYEYFDYIGGNDGQTIEQFVPNSDMGFEEFKKTMRKEWDSREK